MMRLVRARLIRFCFVAFLGVVGMSSYGLRVEAQSAPGSPAVSTLTSPASAPELTAPVSSLTEQQVASMQQRLQDWPGLNRYRSDDAKLPPPGAGEQRVVFFGDSITDVWGRQHGKFFPDKPWINRGIGGQTTPQMVARFQQDVLQLQPKAVIILAGINDIAGNTGIITLPEIENDFRSMVEMAQGAHVRVVLCSLTPAGGFRWRPGYDPRAEIKELNNWLKSYAAEQDLVYVDYFTAMAAPDGAMKPGLSQEGLHPSDAGYAVMEPLARAGVEKALTAARP